MRERENRKTLAIMPRGGRRRDRLLSVAWGYPSAMGRPGSRCSARVENSTALPYHARMSTTQMRLEVNGRAHVLSVRDHWSLLDVLREELDLTGSKRGCDRGECGSCTVLLDGKAVYSCLTLAAQVRDRSVLTVEGLAPGYAEDGRLDPVQQAFLDEDGGGICTPGFLMAARALLDANPHPSDAEIREALSGNLCRCNAYGRILQSVRTAAAGG